ncbi:MAG: TlpA family protein disulfide reductase [Nocardioidaceae bacterium]
MTQGAWVLTTALVLATAFGAYRALTDGHFRGTRRVRGSGAPVPAEADAGLDLPGVELGERATLLQFSSAFCAPCRVTRRVLGEVAGLVPGVAHVELAAEHHLELVRRLDVTRTPTTLILDAAGREISRASGAPRRDEVMATLGRALSP